MPSKDSDRYIGRPSVCRSCGALVPSGEGECAVCGSSVEAQTTARPSKQPPTDGETTSFARAILGRPAKFTALLLAGNVLLFVLTAFSGGSTNTETLVAYGAKLNSLINGGEWWRFVTPIFLHVGLFHLLVNMYGLWIIGPYVEKLYGSAKFVVVWILTGIGGVVASYLSVRPDLNVTSIGRFLFKSADSASMGASGALFGLVGLLFVFGIRFRHELPEGFKRAFGTGLLPVIVINLFIGFILRSFIDNAAHLGGLISGAALGLVVGYKRPGLRGGMTIVFQVLQAGAIALVLVSFFMVWKHYNRPRLILSFASLQRGWTDESSGAANAHLKAILDGDKAFVQAFNDGETKGLDAAITSINSAPPLEQNADALRAELRTLLERVRQLVADENASKPVNAAEREQLGMDFQSWQNRNRNWIETEGQKFGFRTLRETKPAVSPSK